MAVPDLSDRVAVVTGAGTGIGRGIARALATAGAIVVVAGRALPALERVTHETAVARGRVVPVSADVTDQASVERLFKSVANDHGRLDILVNNAGVVCGGPFETLTLATWQKVLDVNLTGAFLCSQQAFRLMKSGNGGRILNVGSISAFVPRQNAAAYAAAKHGLVGLTKSIALDGRPYGISAGCLHLGNVSVERVVALPDDDPLKAEPMMSVDDVATLALTMLGMPATVNVLETIALPVDQAFLGRG